MIASSDEVVSLFTSDKLDTSQRYPVCDLNEVDKIATDLDSDNPKLSSYVRKGIEIL